MPCWVREMSDEEAYMQLVLSNAQSELSPLEVGMHALGATELGERGRGKEGGSGNMRVSSGEAKATSVRYDVQLRCFGAWRKMIRRRIIFAIRPII